MGVRAAQAQCSDACQRDNNLIFSWLLQEGFLDGVFHDPVVACDPTNNEYSAANVNTLNSANPWLNLLGSILDPPSVQCCVLLGEADNQAVMREHTLISGPRAWKSARIFMTWQHPFLRLKSTKVPGCNLRTGQLQQGNYLSKQCKDIFSVTNKGGCRTIATWWSRLNMKCGPRTQRENSTTKSLSYKLESPSQITGAVESTSNTSRSSASSISKNVYRVTTPKTRNMHL